MTGESNRQDPRFQTQPGNGRAAEPDEVKNFHLRHSTIVTPGGSGIMTPAESFDVPLPVDFTECSDADLLSLMAQRDQAALGTLYDRHSGVVYATIFAGIVDIDFYPVNGLLYGLNGNGDVFRLDTSTAAATLVASPLTSIAASSVREAVGLAVLLPAIGLLALHRRNSAPAAQA